MKEPQHELEMCVPETERGGVCVRVSAGVSFSCESLVNIRKNVWMCSG